MKTVMLASCVLFSVISFNSFAGDVPHIVPTANCPAGQICCPTAVYCSYLDGCGDTGMWYAGGEGASYNGVKKFKLSDIGTNGSFPDKKAYGAYCSYSTTDNIDAAVLSSMVAYTLNGNWVFGFMKERAKCADNNPLDCTFTPAT